VVLVYGGHGGRGRQWTIVLRNKVILEKCLIK
jgi:hypothetical protein